VNARLHDATSNSLLNLVNAGAARISIAALINQYTADIMRALGFKLNENLSSQMNFWWKTK